MRIAMLSWESLHSVAVGGVAAHTTELAAALVRKGCEVHVFTRMEPGQRYHECIDGVHYQRCPHVAHPELVDDVNNMCRAMVERVFTVEDMVGRFDLIHAHDWLTANALIWVKQGRPHPSVMTVHATEYARCGNIFPGGRSQRIRAQERAGTFWADQVIAVSGATKKELAWMYEVPDWKTAVVYNGVSAERFAGPTADVGECRRRHQVGPLDPMVLFCGRLVWQKGPDLLVEAIPSLLKMHGHAKFMFVGDGGMRRDLEERSRRLGVSHAVRFVGARHNDEIPALLHLADVVCVPSRNEPFGIVVLEAWSASKPVVVTQNGGPNEYVEHEKNGLKIFPVVDSVTWGLKQMFSDFDRARWMGANGRDRVLESFSWDQIAQQTLEVYSHVVPQTVTASATIKAAPATEEVADAAEAAESVEAADLAEAVDLDDAETPGEEEVGQQLEVRATLAFRTNNGHGPQLNAEIGECARILRSCGLRTTRQGGYVRIEGPWQEVTEAVERYYRSSAGAPWPPPRMSIVPNAAPEHRRAAHETHLLGRGSEAVHPKVV